jgi:membrane protein DedA with SNARE-associated domain
VFLGRWVSGVRIVATVLAGASVMPWRTFVLYNALGVFAWSATVAGVAALIGPAAAAIVYGAGIAAAGGGATVAAVRAWLRRRRPTRAVAVSQER